MSLDTDAARRTKHRPSSFEQMREVAHNMLAEGFSETTIATALAVSVEFLQQRLLDEPPCANCE